MFPQYDEGEEEEFDGSACAFLGSIDGSGEPPRVVLSQARQKLAVLAAAGDGYMHTSFRIVDGGVTYEFWARQEPFVGWKVFWRATGCSTYMNSGRVDLLDGYDFTLTDQPGQLTAYYNSGTYDFGTVRSCPQGTIIGPGALRGANLDAASCTGPTGGSVLRSFKRPVDSNNDPVDSDKFRRKKRIATLHRATILSGKGRLWLQAQFGREYKENEESRFDQNNRTPTTGWADSFFRYDKPPGWSAAVMGSPVEREFLYTSRGKTTAERGSVVVGNHDRYALTLFSDEKTGKYFLVSFTSNSISGNFTVAVRELVYPRCYVGLVRFLLNDGKTELSWEERLRIEAFVLAASEVSATTTTVGTFNADPSGHIPASWPSTRAGNGARQTWDGHHIEVLRRGTTGATSSGSRIIEFDLERDDDPEIATEAARWSVGHSRTIYAFGIGSFSPSIHLGWKRDDVLSPVLFGSIPGTGVSLDGVTYPVTAPDSTTAAYVATLSTVIGGERDHCEAVLFLEVVELGGGGQSARARVFDSYLYQGFSSFYDHTETNPGGSAGSQWIANYDPTFGTPGVEFGYGGFTTHMQYAFQTFEDGFDRLDSVDETGRTLTGFI